MIKKQNFGVEIEMTGITRKQAADIIAKMLNSRSSVADSTCYHTRKIKDSQHRVWKVMRDSSIRPEATGERNESLDEYRVEVVTPILRYEDIEQLQEIVRNLREAGGKANGSCGIHVHVDGANHNAESLKRLVSFMTSRQDVIYEALGISDSRSERWCKKLNQRIIDTIRKERNLNPEDIERIWYSRANDYYCNGIDHSHYNETRYHGLNLHSFFSKGTVEFRLFNSTLHAGKIKAYVQFCLAMSAWSITSSGPVVFRSMNGYTSAKKVTIMRNILTHRLGLYGEEFKTCRLFLMKNLKEKAEAERTAA